MNTKNMIKNFNRQAYIMYNKSVSELINKQASTQDRNKYFQLVHQYMLNEFGFNYALAVEFNHDMFDIHEQLKSIARDFDDMEKYALENLHLFTV